MTLDPVRGDLCESCAVGLNRPNLQIASNPPPRPIESCAAPSPPTALVKRERHPRHPMSHMFRAGSAYDFAFFEGFDLPELLRATAWRTSALKADSSTSSPSWTSIARRTFPSRLELKRWAGSFRDAPLAKVSFTAFL